MLFPLLLNLTSSDLGLGVTRHKHLFLLPVTCVDRGVTLKALLNLTQCTIFLRIFKIIMPILGYAAENTELF